MRKINRESKKILAKYTNSSNFIADFAEDREVKVKETVCAESEDEHDS